MRCPLLCAQEATDAELDEAFYDHFTLSLTRLQVLLAGPGQDWKGAWSRRSGTSPLHVLEPTSLELGLKKSLLPNDTRLPKLESTILAAHKIGHISLLFSTYFCSQDNIYYCVSVPHNIIYVLHDIICCNICYTIMRTYYVYVYTYCTMLYLYSMKVDGELPALTLNVSDQKLKHLIQVLIDCLTIRDNSILRTPP